MSDQLHEKITDLKEQLRISEAIVTGYRDSFDDQHAAILGEIKAEREACIHEVWKEFNKYDEKPLIEPIDRARIDMCERIMAAIKKRGE